MVVLPLKESRLDSIWIQQYTHSKCGQRDKELYLYIFHREDNPQSRRIIGHCLAEGYCTSTLTFLRRLSILTKFCGMSNFCKRAVTIFCLLICKGGAVAQSVERANPGEEIMGSIPALAARSLLVWSVSV